MRWQKVAVMLVGALALTSCAAVLVADPAYSSWQAHRTGPRVELARQATAAAHAGDCATAKQRADELRALSGGTIDDPAFLNDDQVVRCVTGVSVEPIPGRPPVWFKWLRLLEPLSALSSLAS